MVAFRTDENLREIQGRFRLTEAELDRAFQRAQRRALAAGYGRAFRQLKRITGEGKLFWVGARRVFTGVRHTGEGKLWVGLNPHVVRGRPTSQRPQGTGKTFVDLPTEFDEEAVDNAMVTIFEAELEKAAIAIVGK